MGDGVSKEDENGDSSRSKPGGFHTFRGAPKIGTTPPATTDIHLIPELEQISPTQSLLDEVLIIATDTMRADDAANEDSKSEEKENGLHIIPQENVVDDISEVFEYLKQLGNGASCRVLKARHKLSGDIFAVKEMSKSDESNRLSFTKEYQLLRKLLHPVCDSFSADYDNHLQCVSVTLLVFLNI